MKTSLRRAEKQVLGGSFALALLLGGLGWLVAGANTSLPIAPAPAPPSPNGFDLYVAAARAIVPANPPVDPVNDSTIRTPTQAALLYTSKRRSAWLNGNAAAWKLFRQAQAAQCLHPAKPVMPYGMLRELARGKTIEAKEWKSRGQWNRAMGSALETVEMGHDIERGAPLIGGLVGVAITHIGAASGADVPPHLSAKEAAQNARRLETLMAGSVGLSAILREEKRAIQINVLSRKTGFIASVLRPPHRVAASVGTMIDAFIAQVDKPFPAQTIPPKPAGWFAAEAAMLYPIFTRASFNWARRTATEQQLLLRLALRAYRLDNGAYPQNLARLAPHYLAHVPLDPFGRGAWRYKREGDSYLAWSIGPDGKDDGGTSIKPRKAGKRIVIYQDSAGDTVAAP